MSKEHSKGTEGERMAKGQNSEVLGGKEKGGKGTEKGSREEILENGKGTGIWNYPGGNEKNEIGHEVERVKGGTQKQW